MHNNTSLYPKLTGLISRSFSRLFQGPQSKQIQQGGRDLRDVLEAEIYLLTNLHLPESKYGKRYTWVNALGQHMSKPNQRLRTREQRSNGSEGEPIEASLSLWSSPCCMSNHNTISMVTTENKMNMELVSKSNQDSQTTLELAKWYNLSIGSQVRKTHGSFHIWQISSLEARWWRYYVLVLHAGSLMPLLSFRGFRSRCLVRTKLFQGGGWVVNYYWRIHEFFPPWRWTKRASRAEIWRTPHQETEPFLLSLFLDSRIWVPPCQRAPMELALIRLQSMLYENSSPVLEILIQNNISCV